MPADADTETPEADRILASLAADDAADRGVPDMLELELCVDEARIAARREMKACRVIAAKLETRATDILEGRICITTTDREGGTVDADQDRAAQHWFAEAAKYRMAVEKGIDTQAKLLKMALGPASARYRAQQLKERAKLVKGSN